MRRRIDENGIPLDDETEQDGSECSAGLGGIRNWKDPRMELPKTPNVEVLVRGVSDWVGGNYYIARWDGKGFDGCGGYDWNEWGGITAWDYIDA